MPARATPVGLSARDLDRIRTALAGGRKLKVVFTAAAGQVAGQVGQVVALTDPDASDEWVVVRFGRDELPFAPTDLALPSRAKGASVAVANPAVASSAGAKPTATRPPRRATTAAAVHRDPPAQSSSTVLASTSTVPAAAAAGTAPKPPKPVSPANSGNPPNARNPANSGNPPNSANPASSPNSGNPTSSANSANPMGSGSAARLKPAASLVVTLTYADRQWSIAATQGSKTLAKPHAIRPAEALAMVALVDLPNVHAAVEAIIATERAEAQGRAAQLRAELAAIEARLAELAGRG